MHEFSKGMGNALAQTSTSNIYNSYNFNALGLNKGILSTVPKVLIRYNPLDNSLEPLRT